MEKVKFVLSSNENRPGDLTFATFDINPRDGNFYCYLEVGKRVKWEEVRRLISLNYHLERDPESGQFRTSKSAFADSLGIPHSPQQSDFGKRLPSILQRDADGWQVVDYVQSDADLKIIFAHGGQTAGDADDLVELQVDFTRHYSCRASFG